MPSRGAHSQQQRWGPVAAGRCPTLPMPHAKPACAALSVVGAGGGSYYEPSARGGFDAARTSGQEREAQRKPPPKPDKPPRPRQGGGFLSCFSCFGG